MSWKPALAGVIVVAVVGILAGIVIEGGEEGTDREGTAQTQADAGDGGSVDGTSGQDSTGTRRVELEQTQRHPARVTATVTGVTVEEQAIYVGLEAFNGGDHAVRLAFNGQDSVLITDSLDNDYTWQPPEGEEKLEVEPGGELTARLAFLGPLDTEAESLALKLNYSSVLDKAMNTADEGSLGIVSKSPNPGFVFERLPIPEA